MRYLYPNLLRDLAKKMVFVGGPRQVGKTYLAKEILKDLAGKGHYFNWDFDDDKKLILDLKWLKSESLIVFDELHKYKRWKNWIKGVYDKLHEDHHFLITGSARLDVYRRGGDSLMGRYHYWRLHPFTMNEFPKKMSDDEAYKRLLTVGGFPEPFLDGDETEAKRWRRERFDKVLRDDIRDLEDVKDVQSLSLLLQLLKTRVGGMVVYANLAEQLHVSFNAVKKWIDIFERMYTIFVVRPFHRNLDRAIVKPPKIYFYDNADVEGDEGARLENLVANHLLKMLHFFEDKSGDRYDLHYIRDKEGREVDFIILKNSHPVELIEVKLSDTKASRSLVYYSERLKIKKATQIVGHLNKSYSLGALNVVTPIEYFANHPLG